MPLRAVIPVVVLTNIRLPDSAGVAKRVVGPTLTVCTAAPVRSLSW